MEDGSPIEGEPQENAGDAQQPAAPALSPEEKKEQ